MGGMCKASFPKLKGASLSWRTSICKRMARSVVSTLPLKAPYLKPEITNCYWGTPGKEKA